MPKKKLKKGERVQMRYKKTAGTVEYISSEGGMIVKGDDGVRYSTQAYCCERVAK